jgi:hypothetical protein
MKGFTKDIKLSDTHCLNGHKISEGSYISDPQRPGIYRCRVCRNAYMQDRRRTFKAEHPLESHRFDKDAKLKEYYGIRIEDFDKMLAEQDNKCAICGSEFSTTTGLAAMSACVDHCHKTNKVRGLLCNTCNRAIGFFKEDASILKKAVEYLETHNGI